MLAMADACIAAQNSVVAAESLGVGSCYIGDILENVEEHRMPVRPSRLRNACGNGCIWVSDGTAKTAKEATALLFCLYCAGELLSEIFSSRT